MNCSPSGPNYKPYVSAGRALATETETATAIGTSILSKQGGCLISHALALGQFFALQGRLPMIQRIQVSDILTNRGDPIGFKIHTLNI
ncbi:hypothetical protein DET54_103340 [Paenibacillus pabuli]|uniref:Uncharacterized protein n=1 Tax=Paenibacillus pabuli TaxID=1472 RepID=A0ABX9BNZ8_9BACL|nr:hypothetical protein DET54_103340 [Paenibacillus pabuli]